MRAKRHGAAAMLLTGLSLGAAPGYAHHSQQPFFKMKENLEIRGVVTRFEFKNPHPIIYLDVTDESGKTVKWQIEGPTAIYLTRNGWTAASITPGEEITVRGAPPRKEGAHAMAGREVRKDDGTRLRMYADDASKVLKLEQ